MAVNKTKIAKISLWVVAGLLVAFLIYFFFGKKKPVAETCPDGSPLPPGGKCKQPVAQGSAGYVAPKPDSNGCIQPSSYSPVTFPMGKGMSGPQVGQWQTYLNTQGAALTVDNYFGCNTQAATIKYYNNSTVSQDDFNNLTNAASATAGATTGGYVQVPPIDANGFDANGYDVNGCNAQGLDQNGFQCSIGF